MTSSSGVVELSESGLILASELAEDPGRLVGLGLSAMGPGLVRKPG